MEKSRLKNCLLKKRTTYNYIRLRSIIVLLVIFSCSYSNIKANNITLFSFIDLSDKTTSSKINYIRILQKQEKKITGIIKDKDGRPLPGVTIKVKGTNSGTITNQEGKFHLTVSDTAVLVISYIGYETKTISVSRRKAFNITLEPITIVGEEILILGYGQKKSKIASTGAGSSITGSQIVNIPSPNPSHSLAGKIPGLIMTNVTGKPGMNVPTLLIRGKHTLNNNSPLIVVDGIPGRDLSGIDPHDIRSITVLKDATAAIYGSRAANGVILVETKKGKTGPPKIDITFNQGIIKPTFMAEVTDAPTYMKMINEVDKYRDNPPRYLEEEINKYAHADQEDPWLYHNTNWPKEVIKSTALRSKISAIASGGGKYMTYRVSFGRKHENGIVINGENQYKQYHLRVNLDGHITENLSLQIGVNNRWEYRQYAPRSGLLSGEGHSLWSRIYQTKPTLRPFWPNGMPAPAIEKGENPAILASSITGKETRNTYVLQTNGVLQFDVPNIEGLSLRITGSYDKTHRGMKSWETPWTLYSFDAVAYKEQGGDPEQYLHGAKRGPASPHLQQESNMTVSTLLNGVGEYKRHFGPHYFDFMVGSEYQKSNHFYFAAFRQGFISDLIPQFFAGSQDKQNIRGSANHAAHLSFFSRINYHYQNKYLFQLIGKYDGSYIFPKGNRFGFFPSISAGWRLSEEDFFKNSIGLFNDLKIRVSWGKTGNDLVSPYQYLSNYAFGNGYYFNPDQKYKSIRPTTVPNPNITWEVANQFDIGIDGTILDGRLSFTLDKYIERRKDILITRSKSIPKSSGMNLPRENLGKVKSWGYDGSIKWGDNMINKDLSYNIILTGGYATNEIIFWDEAPGAPKWQQSTGRKMNTDLLYISKGVFNDLEEVESYPHWTGARPGDVIFKDVNNDGKIDGLDRVRMSRTDIPVWTGGITISASYKGFGASLFFQGAAGASRYISITGGETGNYYKWFAARRWTPENPDAPGPRSYNRFEEYWRSHRSTLYWMKTNYIKLRQAEISYSLPSKFISTYGLNRVRIYANGFNLVTWTSFISDPTGGSANSNYPPLKIFNTGIEIVF